MADTQRRGLMSSAVSFLGMGRGYGRVVADDAAPPVGDTPADTQGDPPPAPDPAQSGTPRQQLRGKMQKVIDDDASDDPNEMSGDGEVPQARTREQARCAAIVGCAAAAGREDYALHLAFNTRLTRQDAVDLLEKSPKAAKSGLTAAMQGYEGQRPGPDAPQQPSGQAKAKNVALGWDRAAAKARGKGKGN